MAELMLGQPLFPGESGIDQLVEIIKVLGTPTREQIRTMNPNYMEHKFPQIKPHPFNKVHRSSWDMEECTKSSNRCFEKRHQRPSTSLRRYSNTRLPSVFPLSKQCAIRSLTSSATRLVDFPILVILVVLQRRCRNSSTSLGMVCSGLSDRLVTANLNSELSISPDMNNRLVPAHARKVLLSKGLDLDALVPMTKEEMMARLD